MPTNHKTEKIGLNAWVETDKPKRSDFVEDNQIIDAVLGEHLNDTDRHLSAAMRTKINDPFVTGVYAGDGTSQGVLLLDFSPTLVLFSKQNSPVVTHNGTETVVAGGFATRYASSGGLTISGNKVKLTQTQGTDQGNVRYHLNEQYENYFYIAFK